MTGSRPAILVVAPHWPPDQGAAAARLSGLARELARLGHRVAVVAPTASYLTPDRPTASEIPGVVVERVSVRGRRGGVADHARHQLRLGLALAGAAEDAARREPPELVLVSSPPPLAALAVASRLRRAVGGAIVLDVRDLWPDVLIDSGLLSHASPAAAVLRLVERRLLGLAELVVAPTREKVRRLRRRGAARIALVENAVDDDWLDGPEATGGADDVLEVLWAGNVGRAQDVELLVRAVAEVERRGRVRVRATIVGAGERQDAVRESVRRLRAPVELVGVEPRDVVRERVARAGCVCVTLRSARLVDAVPSKLLEAMGAGAAVVAAVAGEAAAVLEASGGGVVVTPGDERALVAALERLAAAGPAARREMGARGREAVRARHRRSGAARALSEACGRLVGVRPEGARA